MNKPMACIGKYEILTKKSVCNMTEKDIENENFFMELLEEQSTILSGFGIDYGSSVCGIHFIKSDWSNGKQCLKDTLDIAIQCLAIKDGVDLVRFENGNIGFISYYNNSLDAFEVLKVF